MAGLLIGPASHYASLDGTQTLTNKTLASSTTFPAGHVIKNYHKVFKDRQAISRASGNDQNNITDAEFILIGTGASGTSGDPLSITTDTPASSSSKYLINSSVHVSRNSGGSMYFRFYSGSSFITDSGGLADNGDKDCSASFGKSHLSVGGTDYGTMNFSMTYLWSPGSASAQTISVRGTGYLSSSTTYINEGVSVGNASYLGTFTSNLTVMEVI